MLTELKVSHFAIIDSIHIQFEKGLNILSGETGAGKSILIKSLALLMGAKSSQLDIRSNKDQALIEGAFELDDRSDIIEKLQEMGIECNDSHLIVRRIIDKSGKSKVYLNGHLSTVSDLRKVVFPLVTLSNPIDVPLIEITGQHENKDLMSSRYQLDTLDQFCGNLELRQKVEEAYASLKEIAQQKEELETLSQQREQQLDFLDFQIKEIETLELLENEDEILSSKIKDLKVQENWQRWLSEADQVLSGSDYSILSQLKKIMNLSPQHSLAPEIKEKLEQIYNLVDDASYHIQKLTQDENDNSEDSLDHIEERLSRIRKLQKKFGQDINAILSSCDEMKKEFKKLSELNQTLDELNKKEKLILKNLMALCQQLTQKRSSGALLLQQEVNNELKDLNMKGLDFLIKVEPLDEIQSTGLDRVVFQTRTSKSDAPRELARYASGGELSRILLSLKQVIGANQFPRTFLFDEVDTGVSGPTAEKVGAKLKNLAQHQQVICVTHLPQVACFGDHHFFIEKREKKQSVEMAVTKLKKEERIQEIARLISGEKLTKTSLAHAKDLLGF